MQIWKFVVLPEMNAVRMPINAEILSAQDQGGSICIWAKVDPMDKDNTEERIFEVIGTGEYASDNYKRVYVATVQQGPLVWHIFERVSWYD